MGFAAWLNLRGRDVVAFAICGFLGFLIAVYLPHGPWAVYTQILISYHLFLVWLVITSDREKGVSFPVLYTILTHLACVAIVLALGYGRNLIPFFRFMRYVIAGLAVFERDWLFSSGTIKPAKPSLPEAPEPATLQPGIPELQPSLEDEEAWMLFLRRRGPASMQVGLTIKQEREKWLAARVKARLQAAAQRPPA
jgi:hypothetical protein